MKCLAMCIGEEFQDLDTVKYLLRKLGLTNYEKTLTIIEKFYPIDKFPQKILHVLQELL